MKACPSLLHNMCGMENYLKTPENGHLLETMLQRHPWTNPSLPLPPPSSLPETAVGPTNCFVFLSLRASALSQVPWKLDPQCVLRWGLVEGGWVVWLHSHGWISAVWWEWARSCEAGLVLTTARYKARPSQTPVPLVPSHSPSGFSSVL